MKKSLFRSDDHYFHINADFEVRPIFKELDWGFIQNLIQPLLSSHHIQLHALVMMDTHVHLLIRSEEKMENFFCEELQAKFKTTQSQIDCHCEPISNYAQYLNSYKYIYRNPVEAGLVSAVELYPFSSLHNLTR